MFVWVAAAACVAEVIQLGMLDLRSGAPGTHRLLLILMALLLAMSVVTAWAGFGFLAKRPWAWWYVAIMQVVGVIASFLVSLSGVAQRRSAALGLVITFLVMLGLALSTRSQFRGRPPDLGVRGPVIL